MKKYCIDRFEGDMCVLQDDDGLMSELPCESLPDGAKEGHWLREENGVLVPDPAETEAAARRIAKKMNRLWK